MIKIRPHPGEYVFFGIFVALVATFGLVDGLIHRSLTSDLNTVTFFVLGYLCVLLLIVGSRFGSYIAVRPQDVLRVEFFWRTHYRYDHVNRIYQMKHWFLGSILVIDYINRFGARNVSRLLAVSLFDEKDLSTLLTAVHTQHPSIQLDDYCINLIRNQRQSRAA